jgi:hypothetical protein
MNITKKISLAITIVFVSATFAIAQTPNPDSQQLQQESNGPIKVLDTPPRRSIQEDGQQPQRPQSIMDRLRVGGSFGLSLGTITNINISPMVGLQFNKLTVGAGLIYQYYKSSLVGYSYQDNIYGGRTFAMYNIFDGFNAHVEYEAMTRKYYDSISNSYKPTNIGAFLVGGTYSQPTGGRLIRAVNLTVLYNLNYNNQVNPTNPYQNISPYGSPLVVRASFF